MKILNSELNIVTKNNLELVNITSDIEKFVVESKIKNGFLTLFVPHATAAIIVNEDEEGLKSDFFKIPKILKQAELLVGRFAHNKIDNNAAGHLAASIAGPSTQFIIKDGKLIRGQWQDIFFFELDGPREKRQVLMQVMGE